MPDVSAASEACETVDGAGDRAPHPAGTAAPAGGASELTVRIGSALVLIASALAAAWHGGLPWALASVLVAGAMAFEWTRMADVTGRYRSMAVGVAGVCGLGFVLGPELVQISCVLIFALTLALAAHRGGPVGIVGAGYLALAGYALAALRVDPEHGRGMIFALFAIVWATDTGAYAVGRWLGGAKLMPSVSPNKTWSGFWGGIAAACLSVGVFTVVVDWPLLPWLVVAALASVVAQAGDLLESHAKRHFGVKDTAGFIPGHGGVLDRLDGHLSAALFLIILFAVPPVREVLF
jgi:phosphatidate cytidylyltransferase